MAETVRRISTIQNPDVLMQILDQLPTSIFIKSADLRFVLSNDAHCAIARAEPERLLGHRSDEFHDADEAETFMARDRDVLESGQTSEWEETARDGAGVSVPYVTRRSRLDAVDGNTYLIGTSTNLTEVRKREEQYRALAQTVPVGVWQVDENGRTGFANPRFMAYLGVDTDALHDTDVVELLGGGRSGFPGTASRFETGLTPPIGPARRVLVISSGWLSLTADGLRSAIVSIVDISEMTELKRINDEISRLNRELAGNVSKLKEAQDEIVRRGRMAQLGQLTATVAHEIRNPLSAVRTASFLLERKLAGKGLDVEQQLARIGKGIIRCDDIITQLLDFSRSRPPQLEAVTVDEWLGKLLAEEAEKLPATVQIRCSLGLGPATADIDAGRMSRVIINLLSNASEAMAGKGEEDLSRSAGGPTIEIVSRRASRGIEIEVTDNGPGMSEEIRARILEPLFTTKRFGTGLGLPAADRILQEHGGGLELKTEPGKGASFTAWFPASGQLRQAS